MSQKKLSETELKARAKALYFDNKNSSAKKIYASQIGQFSYNKNNLLEMHKNDPSMEILEISKEQASKADTSKVKNFNKESEIAAKAKKATDK